MHQRLCLHASTFSERFRGYPIKVAHISRLIKPKQALETRSNLKSGHIDIVVGTHALLSKHVSFAKLGLLVIDEEHLFGVKQKERIKQMVHNVHVLSLTATPIPRSLQRALTGISELSLIATPPIDRSPIATHFIPFENQAIRQALLSEYYRGGQSFFVVPRINFLDAAAEFLKQYVPEVRFTTVHGQLTPDEINQRIGEFYDRAYDVLLATPIVQSGLDIVNANTIIIHHSDYFGLSQLFQIRGRIGRGKRRAFAFLTISPDKFITPAAQKRLKTIARYDKLGTAFQLASEDLDIRGTGNLLGAQQSGHIREIGQELYQKMLEEAILTLKNQSITDSNGKAPSVEYDTMWTPKTNLGFIALIPDSYIGESEIRIQLYQRLTTCRSDEELLDFQAEITDRFGNPPTEVRNLIKLISVKILCKKGNISQLDIHKSQIIIRFRHDRIQDPEGLLHYLSQHPHIIAKNKAIIMPTCGQDKVIIQNEKDVPALCNLIHKELSPLIDSLAKSPNVQVNDNEL